MKEPTLVPYIPRLLVDWQREAPNHTHRSVEGSVAFVDISGFTAMSERLARFGKLGAEEVTDVLDSTFARLLAVAYENDGSLLKFGGDALLLFFSGESHALRACHAAAGMRASLREIGAIRTTAGNVRLRMSIGVHSGAFDFFLAGTSHAELIVAGPAATTTVAMEQIASAGQIVVSAATAALIGTRHVGAAAGDGFLLRRAPAGAGRDTPVTVDAADLDVSSFIPVAVRRHLSAGGGGQEHRRVTIAFCRFGGTDELLRTLGPHRCARELDRLLAVAQDAVETNGIAMLGTDIDRNGGKIILAAGAPHATGNDDEAMLRAVRRIVDEGTELNLRAGVNRGAVFAGDIGPDYRRTYTVMGDAVNLAARVMAKAQPGQVLATNGVLARTATVFAAEPLPPFTVKGKAKPVEASIVGEPAGVRIAAPSSLPLVGREKELAVIDHAASAARRGAGRFVDFVGEAGIGKTRLLIEIGERLETHLVLCEPYEAATPFAAARKLVRRVCDIPADASASDAGQRLAAVVSSAAPELSPWVPLIAIAAGASAEPTPQSLALDPQFQPQRLRQVVADLLVRLLPDPVALVVDDAQWMDEATVALLNSVAESILPVRPWLIAVARRAGGGYAPSDGVRPETVAVEPLSADAAQALVVAAAEDLPQPSVAALVARAAGHPLFLLELLASSRGTPGGELPESVESAIIARIDTLAPHDRALLRVASVLGDAVEAELLADLAETRAIDWDRLNEFVEPAGDGVVRFRQALFREAAYEGLPFRRRRALHRRAGEALEARASADFALLSLHFERAGEHAKAWRYSREAAAQARAAYANVDAAVFYRRALGVASRVAGVDASEVAEAWAGLGDVSETSGYYAEAAEAYRNARRVAPSPMLPRLYANEGRVRERLGLFTEALRWFGRGLRALDEIPYERDRRIEQVNLLLLRANGHIRRGRHRAAAADALEATSIAEGIGDVRGIARGYYFQCWVALGQGSDDAFALGARSLPLFAEAGDLLGEARVLNLLGATMHEHGQWDDAVEHYRRARELSERAGHFVQAATVTNNIGEIYSDRGLLEDAVALFRDARRVWRGARYQTGIAVATSNLGRAAMRAGALEDARSQLEEALAGFRAIGAEREIADTEARLAECMLLAGERDGALGLATRAHERAGALSLSLVQAACDRVRGWVHLLTGGYALAQDCLDESIRVARAAGASFEVALACRAWSRLARLTGHGSAAEWDGQAQRIFERLGVVAPPPDPR